MIQTLLEMEYKKWEFLVSNYFLFKRTKSLNQSSKIAEDSCKVFCETKIGQSKSRLWTFPDGTSCQVQNSDIDDTYYCVNGRCEVSLFFNLKIYIF